MNILEEIHNCPIEWKELGKVVDYEQPTKYIVSSKAYDDSNEIPVLTAGQSFLLGYTNEKDGIYQASKNNPVIIFDDFTTSKQWVDFKFKVKSSAMKMLTIKDEFENEVLLRYVWHYLGTITYKPEQHSRQWIGTYSKFLIPIPPLEIQEKIVHILDKFTDYVSELTTELTTELTSRKKQYSFYRDKLLSFEDELCQVEWNELRDVVDYEQPNKYIVLSKEYADSNDIPVLTAGQTFILGYTNEKDGIYQASKNNPVIIFDDFTTSKQWVDFNFKVKSSAMKILTIKDEFESEVLLRYVWYYLGTIAYKPEQHSRQWIGTYSKFRIPIPSLEIQSGIVQILDNFDMVCNDLNIGLPKEIELRQKQYEYFREKLLTFVAEGEYTDSTDKTSLGS